MEPERFGRYEVVGMLGDGAMGRVYLARDPVVGREVAIKTVKPEYLRNDQAAEFVARFRREAQAAGALNHPSIVSVFDLGHDYIVMERLHGRTLQQVIVEDGPVAPQRAFALLDPVADALDHAHAAGIVHRDIKPANIMIQDRGVPKLMDFGVAHVEDSVLTITGQILGSPSYMSPEQVAGLEVTSRSDVYSLAVVAYELLTGQSPFPGPTITAVIYKVLHDPAPPPRKWNEALPERFDDLFAKALAKDPEARFATARELTSALEIRDIEVVLDDVATGEASGEASAPASPSVPGEAPTLVLPPPPGPPPATPRVTRSPVLLGLMGAGLAGVLLALGLAVLRPSGVAEGDGSTAGDVPLVVTEPPELSSVAGEPDVPPPPAPSAAPTRRPVAATAAAAPLEVLGPDVTPPRRIEGAPAPYPDAARRMRLSGSVTVTMTVTETGEVEDPVVTESGGDVLDRAVLEAVGTWRFEPARRDDRPVAVRWTFRQTYRLER